MIERFCVYDNAVAKVLSELTHAVCNDIETAQKLYPGVGMTAIVAMALHKAATAATNFSEDQPLDRQWREVELLDEQTDLDKFQNG